MLHDTAPPRNSGEINASSRQPLVPSPPSTPAECLTICILPPVSGATGIKRPAGSGQFGASILERLAQPDASRSAWIVNETVQSRKPRSGLASRIRGIRMVAFRKPLEAQGGSSNTGAKCELFVVYQCPLAQVLGLH